ncbi:MAG: MMPL family transporter [Acidobacteriota bacterium]
MNDLHDADAHGLFARLGAWIALRPWTVLLLSLLATVLAGVAALQFRLDPTLVGMFPDTPAAKDYREFLSTMGGAEKLFVVLQADTGEQAGANADSDDLADALADAAQSFADTLATNAEVESARAGVSQAEEQFFLQTVLPDAPYLISDQERDQLSAKLTPAALSARVDAIHSALRNPAGGFSGAILQADPLGLAGPILARRSGASAAIVDPLTGAFLSKERDAALVVVTPKQSEIDPDAGRALEAAIAEAEAKTRREHPALRFGLHAIGGPLYAAHDERIMREDLKATAGGSVGGVTLILIAGFEGFLLPGIGLIALLCGLVWSGAAIALLMGPITGVGVGFAAMLIGLGDDIVIHGCSRYRQELADGRSPSTALTRTFAMLGSPMTGAAMTTVVAFAALGLAHSRPIRELGLAIAIGVTLTLLSAGVVGGALLRLAGPRLSRRKPGKIWRLTDRLVNAITGLGVKYRGLVIITSAGLTLLALLGLPKLQLTTDPRALRPADSQLSKTEELIQAKFALGSETTTIVVPADSLDEALDASLRMRDILSPMLPHDAELFAPSDFALSAAERARRDQRLQSIGLPQAQARFQREAAAAGLTIAAPIRRVANDITQWPGWLRETVRVHDGRTWAAIHLRLPRGAWPEGPPDAVIAKLEQAVPGTLVASIPKVGVELRQTALRDFKLLGGLAAILIVVVVLFQFRGEVWSLWLGFVPVLVATTWIFGLWGWLGRPLDLISLVVIPVIFGVGIDDGLHIVHAARHHPAAGMVGAAREAGRGILLANLTTIGGFWSLTASHMPGLRNAGALIGLGIAACVVTSLIVLPALGSRQESRSAKI